MKNYINKNAEWLKNVDFGDIDGLYDPNINKYFIDIEYKNAIWNSSKYFIIGRKGTGKSALYNWIYRNSIEEGKIVSNKSFSDFPFEKLLQLSDDSFSKPNQYQSIWRHIILTELAHMICMDQGNYPDDDYNELNAVIHYIYGTDIVDLYKNTTRKLVKTGGNIGFNGFVGINTEQSKELELYDGFNNITRINERLWMVISNYLKRHQTKPYIIQFDQLDDNYTQFVDNENYLQCIISLFKVVYKIDQTFRSDDIPVKIVLYLRSDIFNSLNRYDPESSRWDQNVLRLNWSIINANDWYDCNLLKLINARINSSISEISSQSAFHTIFNKHKIDLKFNGKPQDIFRYIIHRSFQRPRDIIQFCIKIQDECKSTNSLNYRTIHNAEKEYSLWLLSEIENEIAPIIKDTESLYEMLRLFGQKVYTVNKFREIYKNYASKFPEIDAEKMLRILYDFGIISNVSLVDGKIREQFSIVRNDRSVFNRDLNIITHSGFYCGLHTSKFLIK